MLAIAKKIHRENPAHILAHHHFPKRHEWKNKCTQMHIHRKGGGETG
jgi:hypothetical protein